MRVLFQHTLQDLPQHNLVQEIRIHHTQQELVSLFTSNSSFIDNGSKVSKTNSIKFGFIFHDRKMKFIHIRVFIYLCQLVMYPCHLLGSPPDDKVEL